MVSALPVLVASCWGTEVRVAMRDEEVRTAMVDHWSHAVEARDAVIDGDLPRARKAAGKVSRDLGDDPLPESAAALRDGVVVEAERAAQARDLSTAAVAIGEMAWQCGTCHVSSEVRVELREPPVPADVPEEMARHSQAVHAIWEGFLAHDEASVSAAATALGEAPLLPPAGDSPAAELEGGVHELAGQIASGVDRGAHYGQLLVTCATCHRLVRDDR